MKLFVVLTAMSLSTAALADEVAKPAASDAPLMVSFTDLRWTALPEREGMQFAVLSGDPTKGAYTPDA